MHLLYRNRGQPLSVALYFINELAGDPEPTVRPVNAVLRITLDQGTVAAAMADFSIAVGEIEQQRASRAWQPPAQVPDVKTCNGCDLRWNCTVRSAAYGPLSMIFP
jgi:hypothetical protein